MRAIRVRGKSLMSTEELDRIGISHDNGWVFGAYIDGYIISGVVEATDEYVNLESWCLVIPETVGQYTGVNDKHGNKIYEGDILGADETCRSSSHYIVEWNKEHCCFTSIEVGWNNYIGSVEEEIGFNLLSNMRLNVCEVIGNIHDNPDWKVSA